MVQDYLFYLFAAFTLMSAVLMVVNRRPINSVVAMLMTILGVAGTFFLQDAPFLATLLLMVYAGAIVVLFLFVVMLIDSSANPFKQGWFKTALGGFVALAILGGAAVWLFAYSGAVPALVEPNAAVAGTPTYSSDPKVFGIVLFTRYVVLVEVVAMLLLGVMAGVLMIHNKREIKVAE